MEENQNPAATDDEIIAAYNTVNGGPEQEPKSESEQEPKRDEEQATHEAESEAEPPLKKKRKRGIERHLYPCPHCGEQILDHFTECPKCGGEVKPRGYHVDEEKRKKVVRVFEIAGVILSVGLVALLVVLSQI